MSSAIPLRLTSNCLTWRYTWELPRTEGHLSHWMLGQDQHVREIETSFINGAAIIMTTLQFDTIAARNRWLAAIEGRYDPYSGKIDPGWKFDIEHYRGR